MTRRHVSQVRSCVVDTSAFFALADADDTNYRLAHDLLTLLVRARTRIFTTNYVIAETHALLLNRLHRFLAATFVKQIYASDTTVVYANQADRVTSRRVGCPRTPRAGSKCCRSLAARRT